MTIIIQTLASVVLVACITFCVCLVLVVLGNQIKDILRTWKAVDDTDEEPLCNRLHVFQEEV